MKTPSFWDDLKEKFVSVFKQNDKHREQPDVCAKSQYSFLEATTNATGTGMSALIFLNYCYY